MKDNTIALDFENIWHEVDETLIVESTETFSNATPSASSVYNGPTPDDLATGTWMC